MGEERHYLGHRQRLKERFRRSGRTGLEDYELLELLLAYAIPRRDTKPLAKGLIARYGSFANVLDQDPATLEGTGGIGPHASTLIRLLRACMNRYLEPDASGMPVLTSPERVTRYIRSELGGEPRELFLLLCLNSAGALIHKEIIAHGTVNQATVYPREVIRTALMHNAAALILVHNHPSGSMSPSVHDEHLTQMLTDLSRELGITVHDHLIVTRQAAFSMKLGHLIA